MKPVVTGSHGHAGQTVTDSLPQDCEPWPDHFFEQAETCLFCASRSIEPFVSGVEDWFFGAVPGQFEYWRCTECQSLLLRDRPREEHLHRAYERYYTRSATERAKAGPSLARCAWKRISAAYVRSAIAQDGTVLDRILAVSLRALPARRLELDVRYRFVPSPRAQVLDYGSGNGDFLALVQAIGCTAIGVEPDEQAASLARTRGIEVHLPEEIPAQEWAGRFDLVTANHVLEHVPDPVELLKRFRAWLKPGGRLFIELPNAQARGLASYGRFWRGLEAPRHFAIPSEQALRLALECAGFSQLRFVQRAFVNRAIQAESAAAARSTAGAKTREVDADGLNGPEVLTIVARANG